MGLFLNLIETYDKCSEVVGIVPLDRNGEKNPAKVLLPLFHTTFKSEICITINEKAELIRIERDKNQVTIVIPMTESSGGRSSGIAAHPLCDQLAYVDKDLACDKYELYINGLKSWKGNNPKLNAIFEYVSNKSVAEDILNAGLFKEAELDKNGRPILSAVAKLGIRFSVECPNSSVSNVWEDKAIQEMWIERCIAFDTKLEGFDYLIGETIKQVARIHPKNINSITGNAKLMSCNDDTNFTYRGRFANQDEAILIDAISSQKAHACLKWLIKNVGYSIDTQVIVTWAIDKHFKERVLPFDSSFSALQRLESEDDDADLTDEKSATDILADAEALIHKDYASDLANALRGLKTADKLEKHSQKIAIAIFDAATSGRLGTTFYLELERDEYLESIANWHKKACWNMIGFVEADSKSAKKGKKGKETKKKIIEYIGCPSYNEILAAAYGKPNGANDSGYAKLKKNVFRMLLECMFGNARIPDTLVISAAFRVSQRAMSVKDDRDSLDWMQTLATTCAMIRENYLSKFKEEISMELEEKRNDRDYLYGRLLAVADRIEEAVMYYTDKEGLRTTNALRLMSKFELQPFTTWGIINAQIHPYKCKLKSLKYYQDIIDDIKALFKEGDYERNDRLSPLFLLGYSNQNRFFRKSDKQNEAESKDEATKTN